MACKNCNPLFFLLVQILFMTTSAEKHMHPFTCSDKIQSCSALLYQHNGFQRNEIASLYSVNASEIKPASYANKQDYLVPVNCSCKNVNGTVGYFYDVVYKPKPNDTFYDVTNQNFSGQVWGVGIDTNLTAGVETTLHLLCGCVDDDSQVVVTYTVQPHDTVSTIATLLSAEVDGIENLNPYLAPNPSYIDVGWLLYVPMEKYGLPAPKKEKAHKWMIIVSLLASVTLLCMCTLGIILLRRKRIQRLKEEDPKAFAKNLSSKAQSLQKQYTHKDNMEEITGFESEKPTLYSIEEIAEATNDFDETRKIGQGGYGSVYYGIIGEKEVAIKKMRSNKSKEFLAELKVLCKIHHINVVELLGYASGDDHLYLVYEYVPNGSLSDHLHDPLLKGHQPLSWNARTQVALDAARGIEYIHDHTKARYVHRDIKTTNILLDEGLRAKVADFGLAKLVGRTNEDELIATRLVGTPGYLPPESVKELQVTIKTDVFAFGVVLAELITGQRALTRDNQEPSKMRSLITVLNSIFKEEDPASALELIIDGNLKGNYPPEDVYKMAEIAEWCLSEEAIDRPEMREVVVALSRIRISTIEWEASLGGSSQVFSGVFSGR
ncbi:lysM domain receptor-like kinase 3 isoform X1 [Sesamum indicum]|uniref:LysM domain receptor-like kinase 3 isoform X1 n=1 Tax=Sesamum indicum TaxID=4182 RepID=A0A8M8V6U6_SESIN|nr:lysM domain receptor-like kinase 3 isoform X1 [Sesamum indicum]